MKQNRQVHNGGKMQVAVDGIAGGFYGVAAVVRWKSVDVIVLLFNLWHDNNNLVIRAIVWVNSPGENRAQARNESNA